MSNSELKNQLYEIIASLKDAKEVEMFLSDLCTMQEIEYMAQRVESAKLLINNMTYQEVFKQVNISSATLSRISKCVKYNEGYNTVIKRFIEENK